jgi:hypothetical protein
LLTVPKIFLWNEVWLFSETRIKYNRVCALKKKKTDCQFTAKWHNTKHENVPNYTTPCHIKLKAGTGSCLLLTRMNGSSLCQTLLYQKLSADFKELSFSDKELYFTRRKITFSTKQKCWQNPSILQ